MTIRKIIIALTLLFTSNLSFGQYLTKDKALKDLDEFKTLMEEQSSYDQVSNFDFAKHYSEIERKINQKDSIPIYFLAFQLEKFISNIIDRHANIRMENFEEDGYELFNLHLPFSTSTLGDKIVALKYNKSKKEYEYFSERYPFIKKINKLDVKEFLDKYAYRRKLSPKKAKLTDGLFYDLKDIGELYFKQGITTLKEVEITLSNGKSEKELILPLSNKRNWYFDIGSISYNREYNDFDRDINFDLWTCKGVSHKVSTNIPFGSYSICHYQNTVVWNISLLGHPP